MKHVFKKRLMIYVGQSCGKIPKNAFVKIHILRHLKGILLNIIVVNLRKKFLSLHPIIETQRKGRCEAKIAQQQKDVCNTLLPVDEKRMVHSDILQKIPFIALKACQKILCKESHRIGA